MEQKKKKITFKDAIAMICLVTLIFSIGFSIYKLFDAPAELSEARPHERLKSDYVLMLAQCLLGCVVLFLPAAIEKHFKIDIPNYMEVFYFIFLYCAIYLGEVRNFFFIIPYWDLILHTFSGAMLGVLGFSLVNIMNSSKKVQVTLSPAFTLLFAFCFALAVGSVWEIYEFVMDGLLGMNMQKFMLENGTQLIGRAALADTMEDMIVDAIGAGVMCVIGYFTQICKSKKAASENISSDETVSQESA